MNLLHNPQQHTRFSVHNFGNIYPVFNTEPSLYDRNIRMINDLLFTYTNGENIKTGIYRACKYFSIKSDKGELYITISALGIINVTVINEKGRDLIIDDMSNKDRLNGFLQNRFGTN